MTVVNPKSISGINSITMASGSDNLLTIHTTNTTERVRVNSSGDVIVGSGITVSPDGNIFAVGVCTAAKFDGSATNLQLTNQASDTECFPIFSQAPTNAQLPHTNTSLKFNASTGQLTATSFSGSTGTFSGDVNVGAGITLDASAGIVTAANEVSAGRISMLTVSTGGRLITRGAYLTIQAASGTVIEDLDGNNQVRANDGGSVQLYHNGTEQCSTSANGLAFPSGKGIDFSATSDASGMTSELLDDYEEGTWTPDVRFHNHLGEANQLSYNSRNGYYTKVGNTVTIHGFFNISNLNSKTGNFYLFGLPFAPLSNTNPIVHLIGDGFDFGSNEFGTTFILIEGGNNRGSGGWQRPTGWSYVTNGNIDTNGGMYLTGFYYV